MVRHFHSKNICSTTGWLSYMALIGLVSYIPAFTALATPPDPRPGRDFDAQIQNPTATTYPPDTNGTVSRDSIMTPLNTGDILITDKENGNPFTIGLSAFWNPPGTHPTLFPFDPIVTFDPYTNRWFFTAAGSLDTSHAFPDYLLIAASTTSDPRGDWWIHRVPAGNCEGLALRGGCLDQPKIGFNRKWVVVQADSFPPCLPPNPLCGTSWSNIFVFDKEALMNGTTPNPTQNYKIIRTTSGVEGVLISPARTYDANLEEEFLMQSNKYYALHQFNEVHAVTYFSISGDSALDATLNPGIEVPVPNIGTNQWWSAGEPAIQPNSRSTITDDDDRFHSCIYRNGCLWAAHTVFYRFYPYQVPQFSAVQWWQIAPAPSASPSASPTIVQRGVIGGPVPFQDGNFRSYPSLAVNANEDVLIGYAISGTSIYPSGAYSFRLGTDPVNVLWQTRYEGSCGNGLGPYEPVGEPIYPPPTTNTWRWGDYSSAVVDPIDDRSMWTIQMFSGPVNTMTPPPIITTEGSPTITGPIGTFREDEVGAPISGSGIPDDSIIGVFHDSSSVDLYNEATGMAVNATVSGPVYAIIGDPDVPNPRRLWATHWIETSPTFGHFVAGLEHSMGQRPFPTPSGTLALSAAGLNSIGQLGNGNTDKSPDPVGVGGSVHFGEYQIVDFASGNYTALAVDEHGTVYSWGDNSFGLLGNGAADKNPHPDPSPIAGLNLLKPDGAFSYYVPQVTTFGIRPSTVSCKHTAAAAVDSLGQVWTWGRNNYGQLGNGGTDDHRYTPGRVYADATHVFTGVVSISVGFYRMVALKANGTLWAWGRGAYGALGDNNTTDHYSAYPHPVLVNAGDPNAEDPNVQSALHNVVKVVCGDSDFSLALTKDGRVYGWGENGAYQLGLNNTTNQGKALPIPGLSGVRRIAAGNYHSLALRFSDNPADDPSLLGEVYAWGSNTYGQCGLGYASKYQTTPQLMVGSNNYAFTDVAAGGYFSLMIRGSAQPVPQVWATGDNQYGQLATGDVTEYHEPVMTQY